MATYGERFMRIIVFFDLPTLTKEERHAASRFRNCLLKDGYHMLQLSVYARLCKGQDTVDKYEKRLKTYLPRHGSVRLMIVTEKQYASMKILISSMKKQEKVLKDSSKLCYNLK